MEVQTNEVSIRAKDFLEKDHPIFMGDIVTQYDDKDDIEAFVVKSINDDKAIIYGLKLTSEKDDIYLYEKDVYVKSLLYLGDTFINSDGILMNVKKSILYGQKPMIHIWPFEL